MKNWRALRCSSSSRLHMTAKKSSPVTHNKLSIRRPDSLKWQSRDNLWWGMYEETCSAPPKFGKKKTTTKGESILVAQYYVREVCPGRVEKERERAKMKNARGEEGENIFMLWTIKIEGAYKQKWKWTTAFNKLDCLGGNKGNRMT